MQKILNEDLKLINQFISEELGISNYVKNISSEIFYYIIENIPKIQPIIIDNGITEKKLSYKKVINSSNINISVQYLNFKDKNIFEEYSKIHNIDNKSVSLDGKINFIWLKVISISGYYNKKELNDSIFHEVEHIYQQILSQKTFNKKEIYSIAYQNMHNSNLFYHAPAHIIYMATKSEQDAYANGLYGYLLSENNYFPDIKDISKTDIYKEIIRLRKNINFLENNIKNEKLEELINELYNLSIKRLIQLGQKAEKDLLKKIGKVIVKIKNDFINSGGEIYSKHIEEDKGENFYFL